MKLRGLQPDSFPDVKGLGTGLPVEAAIATPEIADSIEGLTISIFGGNPVATRAAKATIDRIDSGGLLENARVVGRYLRECLEEPEDKHLLIGDVR